MIFLEILNRAVEESLLYRFENTKNGLKFEKFDQTLADFDGALYRIHSVPNDRAKIIVSLTLNFFKELQEHGINEVLKREYAQYLLSQPEDGCSVSLLYDLENLPEDYSLLAQKAALLKRNCFAAVFEKFFEFQALGEEAIGGCKTAVIHYRPDETLYISALADRVTVIFSTVFKEADDLIIAKVFLQELTEVRRRFDRAPQVLYSQSTPPTELIGTNAAVGENVAYITFVLFPRHLTPQATPRTINLMHTIRNYLHYHIKCSKGYIHRRMRAKSLEFIKILNRARPQYYYTTLNPVIQIGHQTINNINRSTYSTSFMITDDNCLLTNGEENMNNNNNNNGCCSYSSIDDSEEIVEDNSILDVAVSKLSTMNMNTPLGGEGRQVQQQAKQKQPAPPPPIVPRKISSSSSSNTLPQSSDFMLNNGYM